MKVAVMMAAYNAATHIEDALASVLRQRDAANLDIIVVNDGSTDGTADIVRRLAAEAPEIRLIEQANRGISQTRNALLDALTADTDLVTTLDADDLSPIGRIARDAAHFERNPELQLHYGYFQAFRGPTANLAPAPGANTANVRGVHLGAQLSRLDLMRRVGRFDETFDMGEDVDYLFRELEVQPKFMLVEDICYFYRRHDGNISKDYATTRHGFAQAVLGSFRRRKLTGAPPVPAGFFDGNDLIGGIDWWR